MPVSVCPQCAAQNPAGAEFCTSCLSSMSAAAPTFKRAEGTGWDVPEVRPFSAPEAQPIPVSSPPPEPVPVAAGEACPVHPNYRIGGTCSRCGKFICIQCEPDLAATSAPRCPECRQRAGSVPEGGIPIGGALVFPALGLIVSPAANLFTMGGVMIDLFGKGVFSRLHSGMQALIFAEAGFVLAQTAFSVFVAVNFFRHKQRTPLLMIIFYAAVAAYTVLDHVAVSELVPNGKEAPFTQIIRPIVIALIWIPYFLTSKRVRDTFVVP